MAKVYKVVWGNWRFLNLSIGVKTLISYLLIIFTFAGGLYFFTSLLSAKVEKDALQDLFSKHNSAQKMYHSRMEQMKFGMLQAASEESIQNAVERRDHSFLRKLLNDYTPSRPYVDLWAIVDTKGRVIARRNQRFGDTIEINGIIAKSIAHGEPLLSTERIENGLLSMESFNLSQRAGENGVAQVVVTPVLKKGRVVGAFITGILLNDYAWLTESISENFGVSAAVFINTPQGALIINSSSRQHGLFAGAASLPATIANEAAQGSHFIGQSAISGNHAFLAVEPLRNFEGKVLGGLAIGSFKTDINRHVSSLEKNLLTITAISFFISLALAWLVYRDVTKPLNAVSSAMRDAAKGDLGVKVDLRTKDDFEMIGEDFNRMAESIMIRQERLDAFNELAKILIASLEPEELLKKALSSVMGHTGARSGLICLHDHAKGLLNPAVSLGIEYDIKPFKAREGFMESCLEMSEPGMLNGAKEISPDEEFLKGIPEGLTWFPLCSKEKLLGVLALGGMSSYDEDDMHHTAHLVSQIAVALDNSLVHKEIERLSITDPLTGLMNRRYFLMRLATELLSSRRHEHGIAVLMIDIDHFKSVNDTYGHQQGDKVLKEVAAIIKERTRATDAWARYGGEEFIGFATHCPADGVLILAEKIRKAIEEHWFGIERTVTVSIGIAHCPTERFQSIDDMIKTADANLYKAKNQGRNRVVLSKDACLSA